MFDEDDSTCEPEINDSCFKHTRQLEGWYCSCRYNHDDVGDDPTKRTNMTEGQSHTDGNRLFIQIYVEESTTSTIGFVMRLDRGTKAMQHVQKDFYTQFLY